MRRLARRTAGCLRGGIDNRFGAFSNAEPVPMQSNCCLDPDGFAQNGTSRQHNAHITETREVLYRWHCWYGRSVYIFCAVTRVGQSVYRCALEHGDISRLLEIPQWMFDAATCCGMVMAQTASVSVETLRDLKRLLRTVEGADQSGVLQGEHPKLPDSGGCAHAKPKTSKGAGSVDYFPPATIDAAVAKHADRGSRTSTKTTGATAAGASPRSTRRAAHHL